MRSKIVLLFLSLALVLSLAACDKAKREQQELIRLQTRTLKMMNQLYAEYGGSPLSESINREISSTAGGAASEAIEGATQTIRSIDRKMFEKNILQVGQGEMPFVLSDKARQFFTREDVRKKAADIYEMHIRIEYLRKKLNARANSPD